MLGWDVFVYQQQSNKSESLNLIAKWQTSVNGLSWLDKLVEEKRVACLENCGYPNRYFTTANVLLPIITNGLPANNSPLVIGDDYVLPEKWSGEINWNREAVLACGKRDLLIIEAWDQS